MCWLKGCCGLQTVVQESFGMEEEGGLVARGRGVPSLPRPLPHPCVPPLTPSDPSGHPPSLPAFCRSLPLRGNRNTKTPQRSSLSPTPPHVADGSTELVVGGNGPQGVARLADGASSSSPSKGTQLQEPPLPTWGQTHRPKSNAKVQQVNAQRLHDLGRTLDTIKTLTVLPRKILDGGGGGYQKWPNKTCSVANFVFSHDGHFGLDRGGGPPSSCGVRPFQYFPGLAPRNVQPLQRRILQ